MRCAEARAGLDDLLAGRLRPEQRRDLREHLRGCRSCAAAALRRVHVMEERFLAETLGAAPTTETEQGSASEPAHAGDGLGMLALRLLAFFLASAVAFVLGVILTRAEQAAPIAPQAPFRDVGRMAPWDEPGEPALLEAEAILRRTAYVLGTIIYTDGPAEGISARIASESLPGRIRELRFRGILPKWACSVMADLEVFLLRAQAAGQDGEEWQDLRTIAQRRRLLRACEDVCLYLMTLRGR